MTDKSIKKSLWGTGKSGIGVTKEGDIVSRGRVIAPMSPVKEVVYCDDFLGDVLADQWSVVEGADTTTSDAVVTSGINGTLVMTTGDSATTTYAGNGIGVTHGAFYNWRATDGGLLFETRLKVSAITNIKLFVGFTDLGTFEAPIEGSGTADGITTNASDAVGIIFDTSMDTDRLWGVGVKADTDATKCDLGQALVADTYIVLGFEVDASGVARFYINGKGVGTIVSNAITATTALTPAIYATSLTTATRTVTVDYVFCKKDRA